MASKRPSIYDVASAAGVSIATVSRVNRGSALVTPATAERVHAAAAALGWRPNLLAASLAGRPTGSIGVVFPELSGAYFGAVACGFEKVALARGGSVLVLATHGRPSSERLVRDLAPQVDGLVIMDRTVTDDAVRRLDGLGVCLVLLAREPVDAIPAVRSENRGPAEALTRHLLGHGARTLTFIGDPGAAPDLSARWLGFSDAHYAAGLPAPEKPVATGFQASDGYAAACSLLDGDAPPDAIVCATDELALGVYAAARELGIAIPGELKVTGWDDIPAARALSPALTTVTQPMRALGARACTLLYARVDGDHPASETLPCVLTVRRSCGC